MWSLALELVVVVVVVTFTGVVVVVVVVVFDQSSLCMCQKASLPLQRAFSHQVLVSAAVVVVSAGAELDSAV